MTEFVGHHAAQNDGELELSVVVPGATQCKLVIDTGENGMDGKTKDRVLKLILDESGKYAQSEVAGSGAFLTWSWFWPGIQPDDLQTSRAEDTARFLFSPGQDGGGEARE